MLIQYPIYFGYLLMDSLSTDWSGEQTGDTYDIIATTSVFSHDQIFSLVNKNFTLYLSCFNQLWYHWLLTFTYHPIANLYFPKCPTISLPTAYHLTTSGLKTDKYVIAYISLRQELISGQVALDFKSFQLFIDYFLSFY